jgi:hypothetical protein
MREDGTTTYKIAVTPEDYGQCHRLEEATNPDYEDGEYAMPTIMAIRQNILVGFVATAPPKQAKSVVCYRGVVAKDLGKVASVIVIGRLLEHYEEFMRHLGMRWYNLCLDTDNKVFVHLARRSFGVEPFHVDKKLTWFRRELQ